MKRRVLTLILILCLSLSGCSSLLRGEKIWEQPHDIPSLPDNNQKLVASNYDELLAVIAASIEQGTEQFSVSVDDYSGDLLEQEVELAIDTVCNTNPVAAYAVSDISCRIGVNGGETMLVVWVTYLHDRDEIVRIKTVADNAAASEAIAVALNACEPMLVLRIESYQEEDLLAYIEYYAEVFPQYVIEVPEVTIQVYPETGTSRVLELRFHYVTARDDLQIMQAQVLTLFDASVSIVSVAENTKNKLGQIYSLLVERFQKYTIETSITPAYSLLLHGVGDAHSFAVMFTAICREAGLESYVVTGTKAGKVWYWNIVNLDGVYYHIDLLRCKSEGNLRMLSDSIAGEGYAWDFSAYPACGVK